ncbi:MAG: hypothetical protein ABFD82_19875 [Syntrophaceae bacterium]
MAMEWLANLCSHIPNRGEQMVRYYGYYSNVSRGKRQLTGRDYAVPTILEPIGNSKTLRRNWARLIQKIYEVDPLVCPKCQNVMRIISSIEAPSVIRAILDHLGIWIIKSSPLPKIHDPPAPQYDMGDHSQIPINDDHYYRDPEYSWDAYIQA